MFSARLNNLVITVISFAVLVGCGKQNDKSYIQSLLATKDQLSRKVLETVVLGSEYGEQTHVVRFAKSPTISAFNANTAQLNTFNSCVAEINAALAGSGIQLKALGQNDTSADIQFYYAPMSQFASIGSQNGFQYIPGNSGFFYSFWNSKFEIRKSYAMVATDYHTGDELRSVTLEEMTQAMGPGNDQALVKGSIFYETATDSGMANQYSSFDKKLMWLLYAKIQPGADLDQVDEAYALYW